MGLFKNIFTKKESSCCDIKIEEITPEPKEVCCEPEDKCC